MRNPLKSKMQETLYCIVDVETENISITLFKKNTKKLK